MTNQSTTAEKADLSANNTVGGKNNIRFVIFFVILLLIVLTIVRNFIGVDNKIYYNALYHNNHNQRSIHPIFEAHSGNWSKFLQWYQKETNNSIIDYHISNNKTIILSNDNKIINSEISSNLRNKNNILSKGNQIKNPLPAKNPKSPNKQGNNKVESKKGNIHFKNSPVNNKHKNVATQNSSTFNDFPAIKSYIENCNYNQSQCIQPILQLQKRYSVYYCKRVSYGVRFYYLVREGLLLHPMIQLVDDIEQAEVIVYLPESARWEKSECNHHRHWHKILMLDEGDHPQLFDPDLGNATTNPQGKRVKDVFLLTFKRSYVRRSNGVFNGYMNYLSRTDILPMTYPVAEAYIRRAFKPFSARSLELLCTLRGGDFDPTRLRVRQFVEEYARARGLKKFVAGEVNQASRTVVSSQYFEQMYDAQVIVTSNPSHWEGDFRLCEALATGALIFVDEMFVPRQSRFLADEHLVYYNNRDKRAFFEKLDEYRRDAQKREEVAMRGYLHALRYHRAANLIDYVFRTLHVKEIALREKIFDQLDRNASIIKEHESWKQYSDHGYAMRLKALANQAKFMKKLPVEPQ